MATLQKIGNKKTKTKKASAQGTHCLEHVSPWGRLCPLDLPQPPLAAADRMTIAGLVVIYAICVPSLYAIHSVASNPCF
ncbi:hypothetical protein [Rhodoferax lacus]|uniref:hypothetical protein n=1 Tax=Rhodoferax lacus TaxID=2184758 RepID=UPI0011C1A2E2|nr:hypothetical protein [Rhodoferax lacus]